MSTNLIVYFFEMNSGFQVHCDSCKREVWVEQGDCVRTECPIERKKKPTKPFVQAKPNHGAFQWIIGESIPEINRRMNEYRTLLFPCPTCRKMLYRRHTGEIYCADCEEPDSFDESDAD